MRKLARQFRAARLPHPRGRGNGSVQQVGAEWLCAPCGASNWQTRAHCRHCSKKKGTEKTQTAPAGAAAAGKGDNSEAKTDQTAKKEGVQGEQVERPPAPEVRCAEANAQADALEASAATLRAAGLAERATQLEKDAAELRKKGEGPPEGRRLDLAKAFLSRCEARARKAAEAVDAATAKLRDAEVLQKSAVKKVEDATQQSQNCGQRSAQAATQSWARTPTPRSSRRPSWRNFARRCVAPRQSATRRERVPAANASDKSLEELEAELKRAQDAFDDALK